MNGLYIFVDSERPDQYLNSVVHCVLHCDVRNIEFIHIKALAGGEHDQRGSGLSFRVSTAVQSQLEGLARRQEYRVYASSGEQPCRRLDELYGSGSAAEIGAYYNRVREYPLSWRNRDVEYDQLRAMLSEVANSDSRRYVDVTAIKKRYLGDIVAAGLVEGLEGLWVFDLEKTDFSRPWDMLIHNLRASDAAGYKYLNILDTAAYKSSVKLVFVRRPRVLRSAIGSALLIIICAAAYLFWGEENTHIRLLLAVSNITGIVALALAFQPPRSAS